MNGQGRVFIVEDMAVTRVALESMLLKEGYDVVGSSAKAEEAWEKIKEIEVDLVLLDINLVGKQNGVWLAEQIRRRYDFPIVYLTAFGDDDTRKEVLATNPNGYVMKPFNEPTVLTTIAIAMEKYRNSAKLMREIPSNTPESNIVYIKDSQLRIRLELHEVCYVQSDGNYINVVLDNKKHLIRSKLNDFLEILPGQFLQVHQRFVVNTTKIDIVGKVHVRVNGVDIPVSSSYQEALDKSLKFI